MAVKPLRAPRSDVRAAITFTPEERVRVGYITPWALAARELYALYAAAVAENPDARITLTLSVEP